MENQPKDDRPESGQGTSPLRPMGPNFWLVLILFVALAVIFLGNLRTRPDVISYDFFLEQLTTSEAGNIAEIKFRGLQVVGKFKERPDAPPEYKKAKLKEEFQVELPSVKARDDLLSKIRARDVRIWSQPPTDSTSLLLLVSIAVPVVFLVVLWIFWRRTRDQMLGGGFLSGFTKSPAKRYEATQKPVTFKDVAGLDSVKADLGELVDFLKDPEKFQHLGGRVPRGVLLLGPPGTGKTLLARALAGEADVPFFTVSGSEFIQMFVGVGASRGRDLFKTAKEHSPAIVFVDEIDAVGRQRGAGLGGGHDEREQTLNQILSEMDGFSPSESVIVLAATNRPDVLDPALLRPGRFDRHITVDRPTLKGRHEIFKVHVRDVTLGDDVDLERLAAGTVGLTGADIRNLVNEAALWATRQDKNRVEMDDFEHARDKILMGPKREEVLLGKEKEKTAYHEAGHALLAWLMPAADRVHKVTVIPRGRALGATQTLPEEDKMNVTESELHDRLAFMLGGRAAEKHIYDQYSAGAENDLERATMLARRMVTQWGMSEQLGPVTYKTSEEHPFLGREMHHQREFSEHTLQLIDEEVAKILHAAADRSFEILAKNRDKLDKLAKSLVETEELNEKEITTLIGPSMRELTESNGRTGGEIAAKNSIGKADV